MVPRRGVSLFERDLEWVLKHSRRVEVTVTGRKFTIRGEHSSGPLLVVAPLVEIRDGGIAYPLRKEWA